MAMNDSVLHLKYRPNSFADLIGQPEAVQFLTERGKAGTVPHAMMLTGPSGCGKTTTARILAKKLGCMPSDLHEYNAAESRGIDTIRDIERRMGLSPLSGGKCRVYIMDESHKLTSDAQSSFLKVLEDTPKHVYFMLCTTDPQKLLGTIKTRCTEIKLRPLTADEIKVLVRGVWQKEKQASVLLPPLTEAVQSQLVETADGSARMALNLLDKLLHLKTEKEMIEAIQKSDSKRASIDLCRALMNPKTQWPAVAAILKGVEEDAETLRRMCLGYANTILLNGGKMAPLAFAVIKGFECNLYDSGKPGLTAMCWDVLGQVKDA
jgi:DNA polymerase III gamma/tau subunit